MPAKLAAKKVSPAKPTAAAAAESKPSVELQVDMLMRDVAAATLRGDYATTYKLLCKIVEFDSKIPKVVLAYALIAPHYNDGLGVTKNPEQAAHFYLKAYENGITSIAHNLAKFYFEGKVFALDRTKAKQLFDEFLHKHKHDQFVELNDITTTYGHLGEIALFNKDYAKAVEHFNKAAKNEKHASRTHYLRRCGDAYFELGQAQLAMAFWERAIPQGCIGSRIGLSKLLWNGADKVPRNRIRALEYCRDILATADEKSLTPAASKADLAEAAALLAYGPSDRQDALYKDPEARKYLTQAANYGHPNAQLLLGYMFLFGQEVPMDLTTALFWLEQAAAHKTPAAMYMLGSIQYLMNLERGEDPAKALDLIAQAAAKDFEPAVEFSAKFRNIKELEHSLLERAKNEDLDAMCGLAKLYEQGCHFVPPASINDLSLSLPIILPDQEQAIHWYVKAAAKRSPEACLEMARRFTNGEGVPQDHDMALKYHVWASPSSLQTDCIDAMFKASQHIAERGLPFFLFMQGQYYEYTKGSKDLSKAKHYYEQAARDGDKSAQEKLARWYLLGENVPQDLENAKVWLLKAAAQGSKTSQWVLGSFERSNGNITAAIDYWTQAATGSDAVPIAQYSLGAHYAQTVEVPQDRKKAKRWLKAAAAHGVEEAEELLALVVEFRNSHSAKAELWVEGPVDDSPAKKAPKSPAMPTGAAAPSRKSKEDDKENEKVLDELLDKLSRLRENPFITPAQLNMVHRYINKINGLARYSAKDVGRFATEIGHLATQIEITRENAYRDTRRRAHSAPAKKFASAIWTPPLAPEREVINTHGPQTLLNNLEKYLALTQTVAVACSELPRSHTDEVLCYATTEAMGGTLAALAKFSQDQTYTNLYHPRAWQGRNFCLHDSDLLSKVFFANPSQVTEMLAIPAILHRRLSHQITLTKGAKESKGVDTPTHPLENTAYPTLFKDLLNKRLNDTGYVQVAKDTLDFIKRQEHADLTNPIILLALAAAYGRLDAALNQMVEKSDLLAYEDFRPLHETVNQGAGAIRHAFLGADKSISLFSRVVTVHKSLLATIHSLSVTTRTKLVIMDYEDAFPLLTPAKAAPSSLTAATAIMGMLPRPAAPPAPADNKTPSARTIQPDTFGPP